MSKRILIGVIITECHIDFQEEILSGIIAQAFRSNCDIAVIAPLFNFFNDSPNKRTDEKIFELLHSDRFDGFLYDRNSFFGEDMRSRIDHILKNIGKPVMLLDSGDHKSFETTSIDDSESFEEITDHLIDVHGAKKLYCLTGPKGSFVAEERLKGFRNSMKKHGLQCGRECCMYGDFWVNTPKEVAVKLISGEIERPDAIVCGNDVMAMTLINCLMTGGICVPEDIAVTGYDASMYSIQNKPTITSYRRPNTQMGAEAFRRLYRIITGRICNKIPNSRGLLRPGQSCGCHAEPHIDSRLRRRMQVHETRENGMLYGDMLFDITNVDNINDFADRLDNYTYYIHRFRHVIICLTRKYIEQPENGGALTFSCGDEVRRVLSKSVVFREYYGDEYFSSDDILPVFNGERRYPSAYYISPLHYNDNFFGYAAVSFGKEPITYTTLYMKWITYVNVALEQVRIRAAMKHALTDMSRNMLYDSATGMLNKSGMEHEFAIRKSTEGTADCIRINLTGIDKTYYQSGEEQCSRIMSAFISTVKDCIHKDDICGIWSSNTIAVISFRTGHAEELFNAVQSRVRDSRFSGSDNCNIDFSVGVCSIPLSGEMSLSDAMYKAAVNRLYTHSISEHNVNPQFEKLCQLRSDIKNSPEKPWNISEIADGLFLSKSYLQKIYKSYFGRSIIEEMIQFRIDKAKSLLTDTDMTVTDIARECGYSSYNYFVRQFKTAEGMSPSEYRTERK